MGSVGVSRIENQPGEMPTSLLVAGGFPDLSSLESEKKEKPRKKCLIIERMIEHDQKEHIIIRQALCWNRAPRTPKGSKSFRSEPFIGFLGFNTP